jgi:hypothetical protein
MAGGTIDGVPHIFYGQEMGTTEDFGFSVYAGDVPSLYTFNSLQPAVAAGINNFKVNQLYPLYAAVGKARQSSPALCSVNRCFLNSSASQSNIFAVAKFAATNGFPNFSDVVFAFVNLDTTNSHQAVFYVNISQNGTNIFGIQSARVYNVKNIAAYTGADPGWPDYWLWNRGSGGVTGSDILANGITVSLNPVPANNAGWTNAPFEAQYLKLYDVTPPPTPSAPGIGSTNGYVLSQSVTFSWLAVTDLQGGISGYYVAVGTTPGGSNVFTGVVTGTSVTVTNNFGALLYASVSAINNAGIESPASASSAGVALIDPGWIPTASVEAGAILYWNSVSGKTYQVWSTTNLTVPFTPIGGVITSTAPLLMFTNNATNPAQYFKIQLFP